MRSAILLPIAALLAAAPARADAPAYCYAVDDVFASVKDCEQNAFFSQAANRCLIKLETEVQTQQNMLSAAMALSGAAAGSAQSERIANNGANLAQMQTTLATLEQHALAARAQMQNYAQNFTYPGPISRSVAARLHLDALFQRTPCYSDNQDFLSRAVQAVDQKISQIQTAEKATAQLAAKTGVSLKKLDASSTSATAHGRAPAAASGPTNVTAGTSNNGASSITGTSRAKTDDAAAQQLAPSQ